MTTPVQFLRDLADALERTNLKTVADGQRLIEAIAQDCRRITHDAETPSAVAETLSSIGKP